MGINVGQSITKSAKSISIKPKYLSYTSAGTLTGNAELPSGYRRLVGISGSSRITDMYNVNPLNQGATDAMWRAVIYASNGSYITSTGTGDMPTIGTPTVRIGVNAPSKAVIRFPVMKNHPKNILASTFAGWSDGHAEAVGRGMELTVEYRDKTSGSMMLVFRGMIYQIESGDTVTVTAYDRLMDLVQYSDQYQSHAGYTQNDTSNSRTVSGTNYIYTMNNNIGTLLTAKSEDLLEINALSQLGHSDQEHTFTRYIVHPLPTIDGYTPEQGKKITKVKINAFSYLKARRSSNTSSTSCIQHVSVSFYLYQRVNGAMVFKASVGADSWNNMVTSSNQSFVSNTITRNISADVDWTIEGDPSTYYIGVGVTFYTIGFGWIDYTSTAYADYVYTKTTFTGNFYTSTDGSSWTSVADGDHPEVAIVFEHSGQSINVSSFTVSGSTLTIAQSSIPTPSVSGYLSVYDKGIRITVSYFISGAAGLREIIADLIEWAGLVPDVINENMGQTTYYSTTTYDFMTCAQEILKSGNYAMAASINDPGKVYVRRRHTISEIPVVTFSTDPDDYGTYDMGVVSHKLTAHWMSEKATQAYIAENATSSGLPIALETDDALMPNSLVEIMQSPMRSVITDNTLGTHDLQANAASGKMVQLHTNVFEGSMVLAGYRLDIWDLSSGYCGGNPIGIRVPEYGAQGTAVPTEIVIGDGVTQVSLDNIRTADRSEVANSMGLSADANSNSASAVPESVYIFTKIERYESFNQPTSVDYIVLLDADGAIYTLSDSTYIRVINDNVGYAHIVAVFPSSIMPGGFATAKPIEKLNIRCNNDNNLMFYLSLVNPKYAYGGQNVHVDIRFKRP